MKFRNGICHIFVVLGPFSLVTLYKWYPKSKYYWTHRSYRTYSRSGLLQNVLFWQPETFCIWHRWTKIIFDVKLWPSTSGSMTKKTDVIWWIWPWHWPWLMNIKNNFFLISSFYLSKNNFSKQRMSNHCTFTWSWRLSWPWPTTMKICCCQQRFIFFYYRPKVKLSEGIVFTRVSFFIFFYLFFFYFYFYRYFYFHFYFIFFLFYFIFYVFFFFFCTV